MDELQRLYQISQIRRLENFAIQHYRISEAQLMHQAGNSAFQDLKRFSPSAQKILCVCGQGNNGGDGYVLAALAHQYELEVQVRFVGGLPKKNTSAYVAYESCITKNMVIKEFDEEENWDVDVIVDAIFGIGIQRELEGIYSQAVQKINANRCKVLAIDVPSGLNADTGNINGIAVKADITSTFLALKPGLFTAEGPEYSGKIFYHDLGVPAAAFQQVTAIAHLISQQKIKTLLPPRPRNANKGLFGHVLVIGGFDGMPGAIRLAAEASLRVGAGLVSVATVSSSCEVVVSGRPEVMCHVVKNGSELSSLLSKATVVVIGPGLGQADWSSEMLSTVLQTSLPKIIDADALNLLAKSPTTREDWILTPHPGEASRLLGCSIAEIKTDRFRAIQELQQRYAGVCLLKGAGTLVAERESEIGLCPYGNPGMASAGMGDVLSGVIGGLVAQKLSLYDATELGVTIHALAADNVAKRAGERGMIATDLMQELQALVNF